MKLERLKPEDAAECTKWMLANLALNDCSPSTLKGSIFYKIDGVLYLPIKPVIMLESLAPNPSVTGKKRLFAIRRAMDDLVAIYPGTEIIFLTTGQRKRHGNPQEQLNEAAYFYGFREAPYRVYRLIGGSKARTKERTGTQELAKTGLWNHREAGGRTENRPAGNVSYMRSPAREFESQESSGGGSHQRNDHSESHCPQPLQLGHRSRA